MEFQTNVASVGSVFNDTRKVKVLSLPETIKQNATFRAKALRRELAVGVGEKPGVFFIRVNTKTSRDKIKANQMDFIKTKCKQRNVNHIAKYGGKKQKRRANKAKVSDKDR